MGAIAAIIVGLIVGAATGLLGAGGGILAVPALVYLVGMPLAQAVATSLVVGTIGPVAALAPRLRAGGVDLRIVLTVGAAGVPAAWLGTFTAHAIPDHWLLLVFAVLMVVAGVRMLASRAPHSEDTVRPRLWTLRALAVGLGVGFLTGLLGVGGGFIMVPALAMLLHQPIRQAIGTSLAVTIINSLSALIAHVGTMNIDWSLTLAFAIPAVIAAVISARLSNRVSNRTLNRGFAIMLFVVAALTMAQVVSGLVLA